MAVWAATLKVLPLHEFFETCLGEFHWVKLHRRHLSQQAPRRCRGRDGGDGGAGLCPIVLGREGEEVVGHHLVGEAPWG